MFGKAFHTVATTLGAIVEGVRAYHRYNRSYRELTALDDRQLEDIGISREMIRTVAVTGVHPLAQVGSWQSRPASNGAQTTQAA